MQKRSLFRSILLTACLMVPASALAANTGWTQDYYTYGGFDDVVKAFNQCALIFSSGEYKILLPTVWVASLGFSMLAAAIYKIQTAVRDEGYATSRPEGFYSAIVSSFIGVVLFLGLVVPTGTLQIYDPGENKNQAVGGVPVISMMAAGAFNLMERTLVELVDTSGSPIGYSKQSATKGIMALNKMAAGIDPGDPNLNASLLKFIPDCVYPEMTRAGTTLTINELQYNTTDWLTTFGKAVNPALATVYYSTASPQGVVMSCTDAWDQIQLGIINADFNNSLNNACTASGYSPTDGSGNPYYDGVLRTDGSVLANPNCVAALNGLIASIGSVAVFPNLASFEQSIYLSSMMRRVLSTDNPSLYTGFEKFNQSSAYSDTFIHNLPIIRGSIIMALVVLTPFISLLILTKYWPKGLSFIVAGFAFVTLWGAGAAIAHSVYLDQSLEAWSQTLASGKAMMPMNMFSSAINDRLTVYKYVMGSIMTISSGLSAATFGVLSSISSTAMASTAGTADKGRLGYEAEQQRRMATMEGRAESAGMLASGYALHEAMASTGVPSYMNAQAANRIGLAQAQTSMVEGNGFGGASDIYSQGAQSSAYAGAGQFATQQKVAALTNNNMAGAATAMAGAGVGYTTTDSNGNVVTNTASFGAGSTPAGAPVANVRSDSSKQMSQSGAVYSTSHAGTTNTPQIGATQLNVDGHGSAQITTTPTGKQVGDVKLQNSPTTATYGRKLSRSEVAATEIASKMDKEKLFSNTDSYLKSLGWSDSQVKTFKNAFRQQTGVQLGVSTSQSQTDLEGKTRSLAVAGTVKAGGSASVVVKGGTPKWLPVSGEVAKEAHIGFEVSGTAAAAKNVTSQNAVEKSVTGGATESSGHSTDREVAKALSKVVAEQKGSNFASSLAEKFGLSEANKSALSDMREESAGAGTTTNLDTYMVNDLLAKDSRFKTGNIEADAAAAIAYLDGNSQEAKEYKAKASERFLNEHDVVKKVNDSVDRSADTYNLKEKHESGPEKENITDLKDKTAGLGATVTKVTGGAPGAGPHAGVATPPSVPSKGKSSRGGRRQAKTTPKPQEIYNPLEDKLKKLNENNNATVKKQTVLPRMFSDTPDPRSVASKVNVFGNKSFTGR